jgi:hypothetical protein
MSIFNIVEQIIIQQALLMEIKFVNEHQIS